MKFLKSDKDDLNILLGDPKKAIRTMFIPFLVAMAVVEINQFVDTFWVSGLGNRSAEAVATAIPIYGLMMCAGIGIGIGATTTISFRLGRGESDAASKLASNSIILGIILAILSSIVISALLDPILGFMGAEGVEEESKSYILPYILMSPAVLCASIISGTLRGEGSARKSTLVQISAAIFNMVLDPILIYGVGMGVMGAGLATTIASALSFLIAMHWYIRGKTTVRLSRSSLRPDRDSIMEVFGVGGPKTGQSLISNITDLIQRVFLIMAGGTTAVMLYNYSWRYIGLVNLPGRAFESAMVPVCSASYGQADIEKMRTGFIYTSKLAIGLSIVFAAILFVFAEPLMSVLTYEESMHAFLPEFVWTLRASAFLVPFTTMMGVGSSMLQAMKRARIPMYFYILWGFLKLGLYALATYGLLGVDPFEGIIYSMVLVHVLGGLCLMYLAIRTFRKIRSELERIRIQSDAEFEPAE